MRCVACGSAAVTKRPEPTAQGYRRFRCRTCGKQFNERSGTILNRTQYPSDVIALVVLWRLRYKLALRDLPEMFAQRGMVFSYEAVRDWEAKLTPALAEDLPAAPSRQDRSQLVCRRDLYQGRRPLVLSVSRHRQLRRFGGGDVQRATRHGRRQGVLPVSEDGDRHQAGPGHDGRSRQLSPRDPDRIGQEGATPDQPVHEQPDRAGPPRHQGPIPAHARLQVPEIGGAVLSRLR